MGLFDSVSRLFSSMFGLAQGKTERMTDRLISSNPDAIRSQFRKTKEDWNKDYQQMREAIAELIRIREMKTEELKKLGKEVEEIQQKMLGAINLYKSNPDERYKSIYTQLADKSEQNEQKIKELSLEINEQEKTIEKYKQKLIEMQNQITALNKEEAETVADLISSQKIKELNDRLIGLSSDTTSKNLEAIRLARQKAKTIAQLSSELGEQPHADLEAQLKSAGKEQKYHSAFENAVSQDTNAQSNLSSSFTALPSTSQKENQNDLVSKNIKNLLKEKR